MNCATWHLLAAPGPELPPSCDSLVPRVLQGWCPLGQCPAAYPQWEQQGLWGAEAASGQEGHLAGHGSTAGAELAPGPDVSSLPTG